MTTAPTPDEQLRLSLASDPTSLITGNVVHNGLGVVVSADVAWPDGGTGTYVVDACHERFAAAVDAYHVTHVRDGLTTTYRRLALQRDPATGALMARTPISVSTEPTDNG